MIKNKLLAKISAFVLVFAMMLSASACSSRQSPAGQEPSTATSTADANAPGKGTDDKVAANDTITLTDQLGREVTLNGEVHRIVSGYYISTSLLIALGLQDKIVGVEAKANSRPIYLLSAPRLLELPNVGTAKQFDLEGCLALNPDLVILPIKLKDSIETLEKSGVKVLAVNPEDMDLLKEAIRLIGKATGSDEKAAKLIQYYDDKLSKISDITKSNDVRKNIYLAGNSSMLSTATSKMYQNLLIETAGGRNAASGIDDTYWATVSYEQLLAYNPDIIIIVPFADYAKEDVLKDSKLQSLKALKNNSVYKMPDKFEAWDSPVPSGILGTMWLTSILHGERYPFDEFKSDAAEFYKEFYHFEMNQEDITK